MTFITLRQQLNLLYSAVQKNLNRKVQYSLHDFISALPAHQDENSIVYLCNIYSFLNSRENMRYFNRIQMRILVEETNETLLTIIRNRLFTTFKPAPGTVFPKNKTNRRTQNNKQITSFILLGFLGTLLAAIDGTSLIQAILAAFVSLANIPAMVLVPIQVLFAITTVGAFYIFEINYLGKALGIGTFNVGKTFKLFRQQSNLFREIFSLLSNALNDCEDSAEHKELNQSFVLMTQIYQTFQYKIDDAKEKQKPSRVRRGAQKIVTVTGAGFCGLIAGLGAQPVIASCLPLILSATVVGGPIGLAITVSLMMICAVTAAGLFFLLERKCDKVVNKLWGIPTKTIGKLIRADEQSTGKLKEIQTLAKFKKRYFSQQEEISGLREKMPAVQRKAQAAFFDFKRRQRFFNQSVSLRETHAEPAIARYKLSTPV